MQCVVAWDLSNVTVNTNSTVTETREIWQFNRLATLSCHLQGHSADLPFAITDLGSVHRILENLKTDNPEVPSELSQFIAAAEKDDQLHFQNIKLSGVQPNVLSAFMMWRSLYTEAIGKCIHNRFDDLQQGFLELFVSLTQICGRLTEMILQPLV